MADRSEDISKSGILSDECHQSAHIKLENNTLKNNEGSDNLNLSNKPNTIIIRCSGDIPTSHIPMCATCLKKIDPDYYFLWEFMEFCNVLCISKFQGLNFKCMYCSRFINNTLFGKFYTRARKMFRFFCSVPCTNHYKSTVKCCLHCQRDISGGPNTASFCSEPCCEAFNAIIKPPRTPQTTICCVCQQEKSVDMVLKHDGLTKYFCAKRCLIAYSFVKLQTETEKCLMCQYYFSQATLKKYSVYYENVTLAFCSISCQNVYMLLNGKIVSCSWCQNERHNFGMIRKFSNFSPKNIYICSVNCFKLYECSLFAGISPAASLPTLGNRYLETDNTSTSNLSQNRTECSSFAETKQFSVPAKTPVEQRNVATMCFIPKTNKDIVVKPEMSDTETQTDKRELRDVILPVPVPIYVPSPMSMYSIPVPTAVPFPIPVPVPVFIPITKQSVVDIMNEIQNTLNRIPNDPFEAELLKIADIIAEQKVDTVQPQTSDGNQIPQVVKENENMFETEGDLNTMSLPSSNENELESNVEIFSVAEKAGRKRLFDNLDSYDDKNKRKSTNTFEPSKKISLNYTLGVTALQNWMKGKNNLPPRSERDSALFKTNILKMLPDELGFLLYLFVKELRKPDGTEYAPDTLYYLCMGIQYYITQNGHTDNIFFDKPYDKFCDLLDEFAAKFNCLHQEGSYFVITRVEEEHLWESRQLGDHSPHVLLNTLVYFNTKYYRCSTPKQHLDISFFQILRLLRKKSKSKMLRFHPKRTRGAKRIYEQYENEADRTRCPVSLYEVYLTKCPESVKNSSKMFYLQPEQYCTSDSPLWYMNSSLASDTLAKMLNRVKMVKEVNVALVTND